MERHTSALGIIKITSLLLLCIPLLIILTYNPLVFQQKQVHVPSLQTFKIQKLYFGLDKWEILHQELNEVESMIQTQIQQSKFVVGGMHEQHRCGNYVKYTPNVNQSKHAHQPQIQIDSHSHFCHQQIDYLPSTVYINLLFTHKISSETVKNVHQFEEQLNKHLTTKGTKKSYLFQNIRLNIQVLEDSVLPHHIRDKFDDDIYMKIITRQLKSLKYHQHCRYHHRKCQNYIFLIKQNDQQTLRQGYYRSQKIYFVGFDYYKRLALEILGGGVEDVEKFQRIQKIRALLRMQQQLKYFQRLMDSNMITPNITYFQQYCKKIKQFILQGQQSTKQIVKNMMTDKKSVIIDLFPSEYKVGVYLPILLILVLFPCFNVCRM